MKTISKNRISIADYVQSMKAPALPRRPIVKTVATRIETTRLALTQAQACAELIIRQKRDPFDASLQFDIDNGELAEAARAAIIKAAGQLVWLRNNEAIANVEAPTDDQLEAITEWEKATAKGGVR